MDELNPVSGGVGPTPEPSDAASSRRRVIWVALIVVAMAIVSALVLIQGKTADRGTANNAEGPAAPFTLDSLRPGEPPVSLGSTRGKPVVVNFWASWCEPCRREMPGFQAVYQAIGDRVAFLGIDTKDFRDAAVDFFRQTGAAYPSGFDSAGTIATRYGVVGMPTTVFISADGRLLERRLGELSSQELRQTISRLYGVS